MSKGLTTMIEIVNCPLEEFDEAEILANQTNCLGRFGSGVALAIKNKYPEVYEGYRNFCKENKHKLLGSVYICDTNDGKTIANLFGQERYGRVGRYTDYNALNSALYSLANYMKDCGMQSVAFPYKIGCGTGGGDWNLVSKMIQEHFKDFDVYYCKIEEQV